MAYDVSDIHQQIQMLRVDLTMIVNQSQQYFIGIQSNLNALDSKYNTLADQSHNSFANVDKNFANVDSNFNILDSKFNTLDSELKSTKNAMHTGFESIRNDISNRFTSIKNDMSTRFTSIRNDMDNKLESVRNVVTTRLTFISTDMDAGLACVKNKIYTESKSMKDIMDTGLECVKNKIYTECKSMKDIMDTGIESIKDYTKNESRSMKNDTDTKLQSMKNSMDAKFNSKFQSLLDQTNASTCIKVGNISVSSGNVSTGNVSVTNDSTDNVSDLDYGAEATSNALEIRNDVKLCSLDSELNAARMKNDARCDNTVSKLDDLENDSVKVENRVISIVEPMSITSDFEVRLDSNKIVLDTTNDSTLNDMGNKLCNENDVSTVPVITPVVESNVTSSITGETDMTSGGNLTCNMASCEQTTKETLSDRDHYLTIADTDGKKNAELSQNGTADDISDLRRMIQGVFDKISAVELNTTINSDILAIHSQRFDAIDAKFVSLENKIDTKIASVNCKLIALEDNLMAKLSVSHTASSIPSFAATTTVLSKDTTTVTSSEPIKIKLVVDSAPPTRVISVPITESISFSSGNTSAGDIAIESTDIQEKNSVNTQAFETENTSSQWRHALKKNHNYQYPPRWKKPPKSPIKQRSLSPNWRKRDDTYKLYPDKLSLTSSVLHMSEKVPYCIGHRPRWWILQWIIPS